MGAKWARGTLEDLANNLRGIPVSSVSRLQNQMEFIAEQAAQGMQERITQAKTVTGEDRVARGEGEHAGRRVTDTMINAIDHRVASPAPSVINAEAGFLGQYEEYFGFQMLGTEHIVGVQAIRDEGALMRDKVKAASQDMIQDAARQIGRG